MSAPCQCRSCGGRSKRSPRFLGDSGERTVKSLKESGALQWHFRVFGALAVLSAAIATRMGSVSGTHPSPQSPGDLLSDAQFAVPDDVPGLVATHARHLGAVDAAIFLVDYEQRTLNPLPRPGG